MILYKKRRPFEYSILKLNNSWGKRKRDQNLFSTLKPEEKLSGEDDADYVFISKVLVVWKYFQSSSSLDMYT